MEVVGFYMAELLESFSVREIFNQALGEDIWEDMTVGLYCNRYCNVYGGAKAMRNIVSDVNELYCVDLGVIELADNGQYGAAEAAGTFLRPVVHAQRALTGLVAFSLAYNAVHKVSLNNLVLDFKRTNEGKGHNHIKEAGLTVS
ncbi:hypothetical protein SPFM20_00239 [Salmonella phage SPFM20]|nr:hypothetical protein SPFM8_00239 [Salmonella phage SPFM8]VFR14917.1 hypothetical protein SPFM20_00239 [Salmonella phage SPFM20]